MILKGSLMDYTKETVEDIAEELASRWIKTFNYFVDKGFETLGATLESNRLLMVYCLAEDLPVSTWEAAEEKFEQLVYANMPGSY